MTLRRRGYLVEGWMAVKRFFDVRNPLFHGTNPGAVTSILLHGEGLKQVAGGHFGSGQKQGGISLARTLDAALKFGSYVIVIDRDKLHGEMKPVQYGGRSWEDETEERFHGEIPVSAIRGLIMNRKAQTYEVKEFGERGIVVVHKVGSNYERAV